MLHPVGIETGIIVFWDLMCYTLMPSSLNQLGIACKT